MHAESLVSFGDPAQHGLPGAIGYRRDPGHRDLHPRKATHSWRKAGSTGVVKRHHSQGAACRFIRRRARPEREQECRETKKGAGHKTRAIGTPPLEGLSTTASKDCSLPRALPLVRSPRARVVEGPFWLQPSLPSLCLAKTRPEGKGSRHSKCAESAGADSGERQLPSPQVSAINTPAAEMTGSIARPAIVSSGERATATCRPTGDQTAGSVGPKSARVGAPTAAARWVTPESLPT